MEYENTVSGKFVRRLNRFAAEVVIDGVRERVHVRNTGRCGDLLVAGNTVYLEDHRQDMNGRRLSFTLIAAERGDKLVNIDSAAPNKVMAEALASGEVELPRFAELKTVTPEYTFMNSRFDFYIEDINGHKGFIEVKGCALEKNGIAVFPDAPTLRGKRHVEQLIRARRIGYFAAVIFVVQMEDVKLFMPNYDTHAEFAAALLDGEEAGVMIRCYDCKVTPSSLTLGREIPYELRNIN